MAFNLPPSRPSKRKPGDTALSPPPKRDAATRLQPDVAILVQEQQLCTYIAPVKFESIVSSLSNLSLEPALLRLPNELLDNIASFLTPTTTVHMMEGIGMSIVQRNNLPAFRPAHGPVSKRYKLELSDLRHLALVCRRLCQVVEGQLYRDISLPLRESHRRLGTFQEDSSISVVCLARTLFDRPDLATFVKSLKVWVNDRSILLHEQSLYHDVFRQAPKLLQKMALSFDEYMDWTKELAEFQELALHAIIISLLPKLETFEMNGPICCNKIWQQLTMLSGETRRDARRAVLYLGAVFRQNTALTSIHLNTPFWIPNLPTSNLTTLTLDILCFGDRLDLFDRPNALPSVHTLLVTLNLVLLKWHDFNQPFPNLHPRDGLQVFMRDVVSNLSRFELCLPKGMIPYCDGEVDKRGNKLSVLRLEDPQDIELNPLHDRINDSGAFDWLLKVLHPVRDRLLQLSLPPNWYSSTGENVKAIPGLRHLKRLVALQLPHVALVSNRHGQHFDPVLYYTPATEFLPVSLEILTITQVDEDTCAWLQVAFAEHHLFPHLRCLYLYFRNDYWACVTQEFEDVARGAGVRVVAYWKGHAKVL